MKRLVGLLPMFLAACVTKYQLPPDTSSATITLRTAEFRVMAKVRVQVYEDENCKKNSSGNRLAYFFMDMYGSKTNGVVKEIAADREFVYTYILNDGYESVGGVSCAVTSRFLPTKGSSYSSYFGAKGNKCFVNLEEEYINEGGEKSRRPVPSFMTLNKPCINNLTD